MNENTKKIVSYILACLIVGSALFAIGWVLKPVLGFTSNWEIISIFVFPAIIAGIIAPYLVAFWQKKEIKAKGTRKKRWYHVNKKMSVHQRCFTSLRVQRRNLLD